MSDAAEPTLAKSKQLPVSPAAAFGVDELEKGMQPGRAREAAWIGAIALLILLVINSGGLAQWTQRLPSTATNAWIAETADAWHQVMLKLGPAALFERARERFRID